nr:MAG: ORF1 [TTV-like mini virus]
MPWWWSRPTYYRRRRTWRRRLKPRRPFRRRLWRHRRRRYPRVRRKLPFLHLKQWQPRFINRLKIIATMPLYITTSARIDHNLRLFESVIAPHNVPSLGGFSITVFTLNGLYDLFLKGRAWWTHSNNETPLIRYTGATITLYRAENSDYIVKYHNCYPMTTSLEAYNSTQPSIMQLSKNHLIMRCKKHNNIRKPYKKIHIRPPSQLTNKWFFQKDLADTPLLMIYAAAMSLDRYYIASNSQSSSIGFTGLNTDLIQHHDFLQQTTHGYRFKDGLYLWSVQQSQPPPTSLENIEVQNLIYLGNSQKLQPGTTIKDCSTTQIFLTKKQTYLSSFEYWGNPFIKTYFQGTGILLFTTQAPATVLANFNNATDKLKTTGPFKYFTDPLTIEYRYNPFFDTGVGNKTYLVDLHSQTPGWQPPTDEKLQNNNLPLWLSTWGFTDWQKLNNIPVDTDKLIVFQTKYITPKTDYIVPIDQDFLKGNSPFRGPNEITASDRLQWHPKTCFQYQTISNICVTGPGTIKLPPNVSAEAHMSVKFYFKLGGCAQTIKNIEKPSDQPNFPLPNTEFGTNSLQSPQTAIENFLYSFDWRRDYLTKSATERITEHQTPEISTFTSTGIDIFSPKAPEPAPQTGQTEEQKEETKTLLQLINLLRIKQLRYRQQIEQLVDHLE